MSALDLKRTLCILAILFFSGTAVQAGDWPQWRYDAGRGAVTPEQLATTLHLAWTRQLPAPEPAWPASQPWLRFDASYTPVAAAGRLFVPSMVDDCVTAYDLSSGRELWRFFADGPVRLAPAVDAGRVYFGSDDGHLYCLEAATGKLLWRVMGGPLDRRVLGNGRLISTWPVRSGPVLRDGIAYFTAGIWPLMGIFVRAVDAQTGKVLWTNSGDAMTYQLQPHNSPAFAGFVPRGYLAATSDTLVAAGGRTQPGCYDLKTGRFRFFEFGPKNDGAWQVAARDQWYFNGRQMLRTADGKPVIKTPGSVVDDRSITCIEQSDVVVRKLQPEEQVTERKDKEGRTTVTRTTILRELGRNSLPDAAPKRLFLKAGSQLVLADAGKLALVEMGGTPGPAKIVWQTTFDGKPWDVLAADGHLVLVTLEGTLYCFGPRSVAQPPSAVPPSAVTGESAQPRAAVLPGDGLAARTAPIVLCVGVDSADELQSLASKGQAQVVAFCEDAAKVDALRRQLVGRGVHASSVAVYAGPLGQTPLAPYLAAQAVVGAVPEAQQAQVVSWVFARLRPLGGKARFPALSAESLTRLLAQLDLQGAKVNAEGAGSVLVRPDAPPGAGQWTHQYADAANTVVSPDKLVRAPLGVLWWGGPSHDDVLPRHGHGPNPQVAAGRLLIEGPDMLRAIDIYTGRLIWQKRFPELGKFYDNTSHQPGAAAIGGNYVTLADEVFVVRGDRILALDAASGNENRQYVIPPEARPPKPAQEPLEESPAAADPDPDDDEPGAAKRKPKAKSKPKSESKPKPQSEPKPTAADDASAYFAFLAVDGDRVVATVNYTRYATASPRLVVYDRRSGKMLWQRAAKYGFRHNGVCVAAGRVFSLDVLSRFNLARAKRLGQEPEKQPGYEPRLLALDLNSGREIWSTTRDVFGTFLSYSQEHGVLLESGSPGRDRAPDEADSGMIAYRGADGRLLWQDLARTYKGPCMLHHDTIITQGEAYELLTGKPKLRKDPMSGKESPWKFTRNYGCNTAIASENLITFRSAAAGYFDLTCDGGTGNLGGFKSGCSSNLIAAGGVLCAPDYTRTCTCRYQNQTSLALIHDPNVEMWTFSDRTWSGEPVSRVGINFGAPGDRLAGGVLWLDYPSVGGKSPDVPIALLPDKPTTFRLHSSLVKQSSDPRALGWVAASGIQDVERITLTLSQSPQPRARRYTVRLHFLEPDEVGPRQRAFTVSVQNQLQKQPVDIAAEVGRMTPLVKEFRGVAVTDKLVIVFASKPGSRHGPLCCGVEVTAQP